MDYSNDPCMNMYSTNQSIIMREVLELARPGLIEGQDGEEECPLSGDVNTDGIVNIQDVIILVNVVLGTATDLDCADYNADGMLYPGHHSGCKRNSEIATVYIKCYKNFKVTGFFCLLNYLGR